VADGLRDRDLPFATVAAISRLQFDIEYYPSMEKIGRQLESSEIHQYRNLVRQRGRSIAMI
jgi:hypothetical protein